MNPTSGRCLPLLLAATSWLTLSSLSLAQSKQDEPIFTDVRLMAADLVDDMVFAWSQQAPVSSGGRVTLVLADVNAPVGLDERFGVMVEDRLYELVAQNPSVPVDLAHCGVCTRMIAKSNPTGTVISRGIDQPEVLAQLLKEAPGRLGLSLDFEAVDRGLTLRAQIFDLGGPQKILWAQSFTTSLSARVALRDAAPLISLQAAREEQRQILRNHDPIEASTRIVIRSFNSSANSPVAAVPLPFIEQSFEAVPLPKRNLRTGVTVGFTSVENTLSAWTVGGHLATLLLRDEPSLTTPDLYAFVGLHYIRMRGPGALPFGENQPTLQQIQGTTTEPRASLVAYRLGLETHIKFRMGMLFFVEYIPILKGNDAIDQKSLLGIPYHDMGGGMVIRW